MRRISRCPPPCGPSTRAETWLATGTAASGAHASSPLLHARCCPRLRLWPNGLGSRPSHSPQLARHVPDPGAGRGPWRSPACARAVRGVPGLYGTCTERRSAVLGTGHPGGSPAGRQSRNPHACIWVRHTPSVRTGPVSCRPCCGARQADQDATQRSVRRIQVCGPFTSAQVGRGSTPAHA
jgi:hypothetical protein